MQGGASMGDPGPTINLGLPADTAHSAMDPRTVFLVNASLCALSVVGALCMILPFLLSPAYRRLRHRLIFGLALSDFVTAMSILVPTCIGLSGATPENDTSCRTAGFLYLSFILSSSMWTLSIAVTTYALLVYPLSRFTDWLARPKSVFLMGIAIWSIGAIITGAGYARFGFQRSGTICYFGDEGVQFGNLILLLFRMVVFATVICLYIRLFFMFKSSRKEVVVSDYDEQMPEQPPEDAYCPLAPTMSSSDGSKTSSSAAGDKPSTMEEKQSHLFGGWTWHRQSLGDLSVRKDSKDSSASTVLPAYSATALRRSSEKPVRCFQRPCPPSRANSEGVNFAEMEWKKLSLRTDVDQAKRDAPASPRTLVRPPAAPSASASSPPLFAPTFSIPGSPSIEQDAPLPSPSPATSPLPSNPATPSLSHAKSLKRKTPPAASLSPPRQSGAAALALALTRSISRVRSEASSAPPPASPPLRTRRAPTIPSGQEIVAMGDAKRRASERKVSTIAAAGGAREEDLSMDLVLNGGASIIESGDGLPGERKRRMSAQEMNRKASLLMMLYPAAYMVCFSISLGRLINDLTSKSSNPNDLLSILAKWFIYATGFVDCMVFLVIEGGVRRFYR